MLPSAIKADAKTGNRIWNTSAYPSFLHKLGLDEGVGCERWHPKVSSC